MDFFGLQKEARRRSFWLVVLFALAVLLVAAFFYFAIVFGAFISAVLFGFDARSAHRLLNGFWHPQGFVLVYLAALAVILGGSLMRIAELRRGGGAMVAQMLGGAPVPRATDNPLERRLLNVVEEMAIASGVPAPPVWVLPESGVNAFAAGHSPSDAVIAVTNGALSMLGRDELQGVIAHEFSHILNGDIALKMRMMGLLHGITMLADSGLALINPRVVRTGRRGRETRVSALAVIGFFIFLFGTFGLVLADLIKRAVSRQREFLADAAAVQFTRNPAGLANALKIIGGYRRGSEVKHPAARQASHFFFGGISSDGDWWATHPPLIERIRRLDPSFRGKPQWVDSKARMAQVWREAAISMAVARGEDADRVAGKLREESAWQSLAEQTDALLAQAGTPALEAAQAALQRIPSMLRWMARDPFAARAVVLAMLLSTDPKVRAVQLKAIERRADAPLMRDVLDAYELCRNMDAALRLPLFESLLSALGELSERQYRDFRRLVNALIRADKRLDAFEYMLHRLLKRHLDRRFRKQAPALPEVGDIGRLSEEASAVLAMMIAHGGHARPAEVFRRAAELAGLRAEPPDAWEVDWKKLDRALNRLARAAPELKRRIMRGCIAAMLADGRVRAREYELLRAVAGALDVPMPPLAPGDAPA